MASLTFLSLALSIFSSSSAQSTLQTITTSASTTLAIPTAPYTGQALLTGSCDQPQYTPIQFADGGQLIVPLIGCSDDHPECCPSLSPGNDTAPAETISYSGSITVQPTGIMSMLSRHPLTICPHDFTDIDPVCCPSGYRLYNRVLAGELPPCYSQLSTTMSIPQSVLASISESAASVAQTITDTVTITQTVNPTTSTASAAVSIAVVQVFALPLPCETASPESDGLATGSKIGIGVGVGVGGLALIAATWFCCMRHRHRKEERNNKERGTLAGRSEPMDPAAAEFYHAQQQGMVGGAYYQQRQSNAPHDKHLSGPVSPPMSSGGGDYAQGYMHGVHSALAIAQGQGQGPRSPPGYDTPRLGSTGAGFSNEYPPRMIDGGELAGRERLEMEGDHGVRGPSPAGAGDGGGVSNGSRSVGGTGTDTGHRTE